MKLNKFRKFKKYISEKYMKKILNKIVLLLKQILQNEIQNKIFFILRIKKMENKNMKECKYYR